MFSLGRYVDELGTDALVIADAVVWELLGETVEQSLADAGVRLIQETFGGECSRREIERVRGLAEREGAGVVVGLGGGKAMDTAKAVGHAAGLKRACVPTIVSTATPILVDRNPDLVLDFRASARERSA
jgi:glycerol dehydrogenase